MLLADGFDDALLGVGMRCGQRDVAVYDLSKIIDILMKRDGLSEEEAWEHADFNILGGWVGEETPMFVRPATAAEVHLEFSNDHQLLLDLEAQ